MATLLDSQVGVGRESPWKTPVTVSKFHQPNASGGMRWDAGIQQATPIRVGSIGDRADREWTAGAKATGGFEYDLTSKGFGVPLESAWGTATSTLVSGTTFQQVFTPGRTGTTRPSSTIQQATVRTDGSVDAYTYAGCTVDSFEIDLPTNGKVTLKLNYVGYALATATALATASFPAAESLFEFDQAVLQYGGTLTAPTTTALASMAGGTTATEFLSFNLACNSNLNERPSMAAGNWNQPLFGKFDATVKAAAEYQNSTWRDAYLNRTSNAMLLTLTTSEALSSGFATMQIALPIVRPLTPMGPDLANGDVPQFDFEGKVFDDVANARMAFMVLRTSDSAL